MKITVDNRKKMAGYIEQTLKAFNVKAQDIVTESTMFTVWHKTYSLVVYSDTNPNALLNGKRVIDQDKSLEMYPNDSNDNHIYSALK